jgi:hypothetical protein
MIIFVNDLRFDAAKAADVLICRKPVNSSVNLPEQSNAAIAKTAGRSF